MSSRTTRPNGHTWIHFSFDSKRHTVRLGLVSRDDAAEFQRKLDRTIKTRHLGLEPDPELRVWFTTLSNQHHGNLAKAGLLPKRGARTLGELETAFLEHLRRENAKPRTIANVKVVLRNLTEHFGQAQTLGTITPDDAAEFRSELRDFGRVGGGSLERTTVSRRTRRAREIFAFAVEQKWIEANPFAKQRKWNEVNRSRDCYVPASDVEKLIKVAPDDEWRLLLALTRYAGVRCPSEVHPLEWSWVNWDEGTIRVFAPKTEHIPDKDWRIVPVLEEVARHLHRLHEQRLVGQRFVFPNCQSSGANLTAKLHRICQAAEVPKWPKAWVNMRASCERDMLLNHPIDVVAGWLGHSPETALRHYKRVVKEQQTRDAGRALRLFKPADLPDVKGEAS